MPKQFLYCSKITTIFQQMCCKARSDEMWVMTTPWFGARTPDDCFISSTDSKGLGGVFVHYYPNCPTGAKCSAMLRNKQYRGLSRACSSSKQLPAFQEIGHDLRERHNSLHTAFTADIKCVVGTDITKLKVNQLRGSDTCFISQSHNNVVSKTHQGSEIGCCEQLAGLIFSQVSRQPWANSTALWNKQCEVLVRVGHFMQPFIKAAQSIDTYINSALRGPGAIFQPTIKGGF